MYPGVKILPDGAVVGVTYEKWDADALNSILDFRFHIEKNQILPPLDVE